MGLLFCKSKKTRSKEEEIERFVLGLKRQRDGMIEYQRRTRKCLRKDREVTIKLLKDGKEDHAKILMKKVKCQERDLQASYGQLRNLQELVYTMEMALILCR
ncbi:charged multivesicular body protein 6 isoform X2 [Cryptotermes secundus]|uniref:charged multivesicular body protein 6 isoform X2 n=1 Tax=Cryptotermes secundus TaxID=105785 RepID=UPI000CD7C9F5|nr:charged multivesicular body protein 6 isoform X2 [Cryptotermes secundus]XP_023712667.1 charged multivesicular body protein 6 isoform X2 [Cryptotermes secundus]XP_023712668.1 charged multivesicular body protein 6 isoform X2 [Cryptotermes secundus]XP_023712669.1 charged multivesicular body protein 6 isoform X2 [Cryptotermes secundus]XP_023712670.1 charged multivesicular body protein 6 isoform X2 [Cryptotermes secundus]XP_023712671.1 charged multivesicular body protein 6 isoform X2 [Cryptoterm